MTLKKQKETKSRIKNIPNQIASFTEEEALKLLGFDVTKEQAFFNSLTDSKGKRFLVINRGWKEVKEILRRYTYIDYDREGNKKINSMWKLERVEDLKK